MVIGVGIISVLTCMHFPEGVTTQTSTLDTDESYTLPLQAQEPYPILLILPLLVQLPQNRHTLTHFLISLSVMYLLQSVAGKPTTQAGKGQPTSRLSLAFIAVSSGGKLIL